MTTEAPLKLRARDKADIETLSLLLQDAVVALADIAYVPEEGLFALTASRFCWENLRYGPLSRGLHARPRFARVLSGFAVHHVRSVQRRALEEAAKGGFLELLALSLENRPAGADDGTLVLRLTFAGGASLRLTLSALSCGLEDLADPWPTRWRPRHG